MQQRQRRLSILRRVLLAVVPVFAFVGFAVAAVTTHATPTSTNLIIRPSSTVYDSSNVVGVPGDSATGFASGSIASNGTGKTDMYFTPTMLFGHDITLGDIASISYWTKTGQTHTVSPGDWSLVIYTNPYPTDTHGGTSWYGDRIGAEPYFSQNLTETANEWNKWSTDGPTNQLRFYESTAGYYGSYADPTWSTFVAGNALSTDPYAGHGVKFISLQTGSAWATGFTGQLDGLTIMLSDDSTATVNFEPNDTTKPTVSFVSPTDFSTPFMHGPNVTISAEDNVGGSGLATMVIHAYVAGSNTPAKFCSANTTELTAGLMSCDLSSLQDGTYYIKAGATDKAGNNKTINSGIFVINNVPSSIDQCKNNGWKSFPKLSFKNQGSCVSWVQHNVNGNGMPAIKN